MPTPYPKPGARRRRGNDEPRQLEQPDRRAPAVPRGRGADWPPHVKRWWQTIWIHPVAADWDEVADFAAVARLATLYAAGADLSAAMLAQIGRLESELLLTPASRKRAYVRLPRDNEPEPDRPAPARKDPYADVGTDRDPRRALVDPPKRSQNDA